MDPAAIIADLASAHFSLSEVAARHNLTLDALAAFITSDQAQQKLDQLQSAAAISTRFAAQLHLPLAVAALGTLLTCHRAAVLITSPPQQASPPSTPARLDTPPVAQEQHDSPRGKLERHDEGRLPLPAPNQPNPSPPAPTLSDDARPARAHARTLRLQVELRRAAATLLRYANFNHRALSRSRTNEPRHASAPPDHLRGSNPHASINSSPWHATVESQTPRVSAAHAPPSDSTPTSLTHAFGPRDSVPHFGSFADLFAAALAAVNSADDSADDSADEFTDDSADVTDNAAHPAPDDTPAADVVTDGAACPAPDHTTPTAVTPHASTPADSSSLSSLASATPTSSTSTTSLPRATTQTPPHASIPPAPHAARFSNVRLSPRRPSAAHRLASSAGASNHPP